MTETLKLPGRGYITKSKAGHYTAKAVDATGNLIAIQDKLADLEAARSFIRNALDPDSDFSRLRRHRDLHRTVPAHVYEARCAEARSAA